MAQKEALKLHLKILEQPQIPIDEMVEAMKKVYATADIQVDIISTEILTEPLLMDLDVGRCVKGETTQEQDKLFSNRNNMKDNELAIYFVRSTIPPYNGCAAHPSGRPGAVVTRVASVWTLGHEVGHVLGLSHVNDLDRLMTGGGTNNITNPPPDLVSPEIETIRQSPYTIPTIP
ncbi:hypothetical protein JI735_19630 [Paenibacillus sonchi]|uniref:Peptidase M10 metallopeptidase domain-containing protein n=1 Tax=Paenibacillus sonchi TaxID=373687 RepID=A0A974P8N0_9BACL|nr:hypothetical protein [Paenibacillus sonchi]QQZ58941.1 hypothetical protein JI735_19630 [Paenibacillus sonchi]